MAGLSLAEGDLEEYLKDGESRTDKEEMKKAVRFLCRNVDFGSLEVAVQKAAMVLDSDY